MVANGCFEEDITETLKNMGKFYQSVWDTILLEMKDAYNGGKDVPLKATACPNVCSENMDIDQGAC